MNRYWRKRKRKKVREDAQHNWRAAYRKLLRKHTALEQEVTTLQDAVKCLNAENSRLEQERQAALQARQDDQRKWELTLQQQLLANLRKMGEGREFILDALETLDGKGEAKPTRSARSVLEDVKRWIQEISGARLTRYPKDAEITMYRADLAENMRLYNWGMTEPFSVQSGGRAEVSFRVVRRGWQLGDEVLHRAAVVEIAYEKSE